jgi:UDP-N-acetyl-D-glucosamine/UDP-N-acetyl-D-galactosamine dehydrogenase
MTPAFRVAVAGLGYVGLPLATKLALHFPVVGFDIKASRIEELRNGRDRTGEVGSADLQNSSLHLTADPRDLTDNDIYIIAVPTPVDASNRPDLRAVEAACRTIGKALKRGAVVVLESTVYPGVTEEICGPALERASGLTCGIDFFLGYSPERINPGDHVHSVDRITKVVAGQTPAVTRMLVDVYGAINGGNVFTARDIRTAEAAKVIENAQRDINIAFINEVTQIFHKAGLSIYDVLDASRTKWNFLPFTPGLVGGHCIGVDPFYLADLARKLKHNPAVILAGRHINDGMAAYIAERIAETLPEVSSRVLILGLTFKENVPDLRNSKVIDVVHALVAQGHTVDVHDPLADPDETLEEYGIRLLPSLNGLIPYNCLVGAVAHDAYAKFRSEDFERLVSPGGMIADIKGLWRELPLPSRITRWKF